MTKLFAIAVGLFLTGHASANEPNRIELAALYSGSTTPEVTVTLDGKCDDLSGRSIKLPSSWAGDARLADSLIPIRYQSCLEGAETLTYAARIGFQDSKGGTLISRPMAGDGWSFLFGNSILPIISKKDASYRLSVISDGSQIATNFGSSNNRLGHAFFDGNDLKDTFFFFGPKVQVVTYNVRGVDITFSYVQGEANEAFIIDLRERYEFILGKFDEHRPSQLFVALVPTKEDDWGPFFQGTALPNGVAFHTSALDPELWNHEITHEIIHEWLPLRMGGVKLGSDYSERYVFTEGYTEYLAHKFNLEMGRETLPEFLGAINAAFVAKEFSDSRLLDDPYGMGLLHAFVTDLNLRFHGSDSLFRTLKSLVHLPSGSRHQELDAFDQLQDKLRMGGISPITLAEIGDVPLSLNYSDLCIKPAVLQMYSYELGFDFDVHPDGTYQVKNVNVLSRAYRAGVRDGMTIIERIGGDVDDMNSLATFRVTVSGAESALSFYPKSLSSKPVMQFLYDSSDAAIESCTIGFASFLAGDNH
ncbi:hypothetical protein [Erythrobacter sp. MTPC3]|uniref:hypothetical protein n=1 Tax=Erythrobacter sp. MTPC3 TaxID=3056564 RepID=UPI0036F3B035